MNNQILAYFKKHPFEAFNSKQVAARLGVKDKGGKEIIAKSLLNLLKEKKLTEQKIGKYKVSPEYIKTLSPENYIIGTVDMKSTGKAYVMPQNKDLEDIFIAANNTNRGLHEDLVKVFIFPQRKDRRPEGKIIDVIKRNKTKYVGVVKIMKNFAIVIPDNKNMPIDIFVPEHNLTLKQNGYKVLVEIEDWSEHLNNPTGKILSVLGKPDDNNVEMQSILVEYDFPIFFPDDIEQAAGKISEKIPQKEIASRRDFRKIPTITIDPADAKDFDDAISFRYLDNGNMEVGVHIADVSYYVQKDDMIDKEAYSRATSVYLVDRTIPMLPEKLCNGVCSLRPNEDKLAFSAVFEIDDKANIINKWFGKTVIHSCKRFVYDDVQKVIEKRGGELENVVLPLHDLASVLRKKRYEKGTIDFHSTEVKFKLDDKSRPISVYIKETKEANWLVEEFMLLANKSVAEFIGKPVKSKNNVEHAKNKSNVKTFVYRVHDEPSPEKLATFATFVGKLGYKIKTGTKKELSQSFNDLFKKVAGKGEENLIETISIRTMSKAFYSTDNIGHYGLSFDFYTHFTSPIRRYPDLMVHRLLEKYLEGGKSAEKTKFEEYCKHSSVMEKKAADAERLSIKYKQAEYLQSKVGQTFEGSISGVSKYGIFVELTESRCEGMVSLQSLHDDYYYLDEENYQVLGRKRGQRYRIGDKIYVCIKNVDLSRKRIDFEIA
ncbi:ribonuclease R [Bacteroidia bacterium]|nr:ribonuclease R [Bacteroidia bacterium]